MVPLMTTIASLYVEVCSVIWLEAAYEGVMTYCGHHFRWFLATRG
jgi:hypothetical protein